MAKRTHASTGVAAVSRSWYGPTARALLLAAVATLPLAIATLPSRTAQAWSYTSDAFHLPKLVLLSSLLSAATLLWVADLVVSRRPIRRGVSFVPLTAFGALTLASTAFAYEPASSFFGASGLYTGTITWLLCAWFAFLLGQYMRSANDVVAASWALVGGSALVGSVALLQGLGADPLGIPVDDASAWMVKRAMATLGNPDHTGLWLVLPLTVGVSLAASENVEWRRWLATACAVLVGMGLFVTLTRAAWLGALVGIIVWVFIAAPGRVDLRRIAIIGAAALGVAVTGFLVLGREFIVQRFALVAGGLDEFSSGRVTLWGDALRIIGDHPLFGTGADRLALGGYQVQQSLVLDSASRFVLQDPHNLVLLVGGVFGIPALLALLAWIAVTGYGGMKTALSSRKASAGRSLYAGWLAGLVGLLAAALFSVWTISAVFALFLATAVVASATLQDSEREHPVVVGAVAVAAIALLGVSLYGAGSAVAAERHVVLARISEPQFHLEESIRRMPWDAKLRTDYYWKKIGAVSQTLTGEDGAAAKAATDSLDAELRSEIVRFPRDLLFYRLRIDLQEVSRGRPGFQEDGLAAAIDDALTAFPDDPEFLERRRQLSQEGAE